MFVKISKTIIFIVYIVTIKVPWGHIAGKAWGYSNRHPVLALHGEVLVVFYRIHFIVCMCIICEHCQVTFLLSCIPLQFLSP